MKVLLGFLFALLIAVPASAQEQAIHGYVNYDEHNANRMFMTTDDGRPMTIDHTSATFASPNSRKAGEAVLVFGTQTGPGDFKATRLIADRDRTTAGPSNVAAGWQSVHGRVDRIDGSNLVLRADDGRVLTVNLAQVAPAVRGAVQQGDSITVTGEAAAATPQLFTARFIQSDRTTQVLAQQSGGTNVQGGWQRIHGQVQAVSGNSMTFRTDDGRTVTVDMSQVSANVQRALAQNEGVEVIGHYASNDQQRLVARWIQQDSSNPSRGGRVVGQAPPPPAPGVQRPPVAQNPPPRGGQVNEQAWQKIHGKVEAVSGTTLRLKADDGRSISVDMSKVNPNVQKGLTVGENVTVTGHYDNDRRHVEAQFIQQERAGGAASPKTDDKHKK